MLAELHGAVFFEKKEEQRMNIKEIIYQHRRDFSALMECEGCGNQKKLKGYDDRNYHDNVIPNIKCLDCGKTRNDLGVKSEPTPTKYPNWMQV